jgi:hypothetical protein
MARRRTAVRRTAGGRTSDTIDIFSRVDKGIVERFDELLEAMRPSPSRSAMTAKLIEDFVQAHQQKPRK